METRASQDIQPESAAPPRRDRRVLGAVGRVFVHQIGHLFPWVPVCLGAGVGCYFAIAFEPSRALLSALALMAALCTGLAIKGPGELRALAWGFGMLAAGFCLVALRAHSVSAPVLSYRYYGPVEGRVVAIDRSASDKVRLTLDQVALDRMNPARIPRYVRISLHGDQPFLKPEPGMIVMMSGHLSPPSGPVEPGGFDFQRKAWFERLGAVGYTRSPALLLDPGAQDSFALRLYAFRKTLAKAIKDRMPGEEGPFAAAIITGDRADIDPVALEALRGSNLAHLLAISGLHMGLLTGAVFTVMRFALALLPRTPRRFSSKKLAALCALVAAFVYLGVSGASVATQRAFVMAAVMLIAICLDRRALTLRGVAVAAMIVLLVRPESLVGPGFQMSFAATVALVCVFAALRDVDWMYRVPRWLRPVAMLVISSGVAGLATAPFGAAHFNQMAQYGLFANLLSVPVMGMIVMPGAVLAALLIPFGLDFIGLEIMRLGLAWILFIARIVTEQAGAVTLIPAPSTWVLPMITLGGLILCLWRGSARLWGTAFVGAGVLIWQFSTRPAALLSETGLLLGVQTSEGRMLNKPRGDGFSAMSWLENDADAADQEAAASRGGAGVSAKFVRFQVGADWVVFDANKDLDAADLAKLCRGHDLVIAPLYRDDMPCNMIGARDLRAGGSLALWAGGGGIDIDTSNARRGPRIWTPQAQ